ncbi:hypothetical protein ACPPVO_57815 [Dactylosporangium sp. McL0621]|uniref:hypothetical protein n=1 Tax=Dactylosporangium sp. McL0621 TaxID=3415678 RepID=UPI003CEA12A7
MDDDRFAVELLAPLRTEPRGPSGVDVGRAVAQGERRQGTIRAAGAGAAVLVVLGGGWAALGLRGGGPAPGPDAGAGAPPVPKACVPKVLGAPSEFEYRVTVAAGDPTGRYQVGRASDGPDAISVLWDRGQWTRLDDLAVNPADVNANGAVVGTRPGARNRLDGIGWMYRDGRLQELAGGDHVLATGVNDRGQIVGNIEGKGVTWASADSPPVDLPVPAGYEGPAGAGGIDEDGTVAGTLKQDGVSVPVVWLPDGRVERLETPGPGLIDPIGIRNGWVIGNRWEGAVRWNLRAGGPVATIGGGHNAEGPNSSGWLVRQVFPGAELEAGGVRVPLTPPDGTRPAAVIDPRSISDDGRTIAGQIPNDRSGSTAYLWTCR